MPVWLITAKRDYELSQSLPGWTRAELGDTPAIHLDAVIAVRHTYQRAEAKANERAADNGRRA